MASKKASGFDDSLFNAIEEELSFYHEKINMLLFSFAALLSIFASVLTIKDYIRFDWELLLFVTGVVIAIFNICKKEEFYLIVSGLAYLFSVWFITPYVKKYLLIQHIAIMLNNFALVIAPVVIFLSLKAIIHHTSVYDSFKKNRKPKLNIKSPLENRLFADIWNIMLFVSVIVVIMILIIEIFFIAPEFAKAIHILDWIISVVFIIDVIFLYLEKKSLGLFLKDNWPDIIAAVPLSPVFYLLKMVRVIRILKLIKFQKLYKLNLAAKSMKYFSKESGFNKLLIEDSWGSSNQEASDNKKQKQKNSIAKKAAKKTLTAKTAKKKPATKTAKKSVAKKTAKKKTTAKKAAKAARKKAVKKKARRA